LKNCAGVVCAQKTDWSAGFGQGFEYGRHRG
jgi:hypothetical protein